MIFPVAASLRAAPLAIGRRAASTIANDTKKQKLVVLGSGWGGFNVARLVTRLVDIKEPGN